MIPVEKNIVQLLNDHYINIVERSCGIKPEKLEFGTESSNKKGVLSTISVKVINHPSILEIHKNRILQCTSISTPSSSWGFKIMHNEIKNFLKSLCSKKDLE